MIKTWKNVFGHTEDIAYMQDFLDDLEIIYNANSDHQGIFKYFDDSTIALHESVNLLYKVQIIKGLSSILFICSQIDNLTIIIQRENEKMPLVSINLTSGTWKEAHEKLKSI